MTGTHERFVGLDLAGSPKRPSGFCLLEGNRADVSVLYTDEEILRAIGDRVEAVAIDALTCAVVAREEGRGNAMVIGDPKEGVMILPRIKSIGHRARSKE